MYDIMIQGIRCPHCRKTFNSTLSYNDHKCTGSVIGGLDDLGYGSRS